MPLGYDGFTAADINSATQARNAMASGIAQLGKQVREDMMTIATNRQVRAMGQELQQTNPQSEFFPQQMVGIVSRYPLGAQHPAGVASINALGASHKSFLQSAAKVQQQFAPVPGAPGYTFNRETGDVKEPSVEMPQKAAKPVIVKTPTGAILVDPVTGEQVSEFGDPFAQKPVVREVNGQLVDVSDPRNPQVIHSTTPPLGANQQKQLGVAVDDYFKKVDEAKEADHEAQQLESEYNTKGNSFFGGRGSRATEKRAKASELFRQAEEAKRKVDEMQQILSATPAVNRLGAGVLPAGIPREQSSLHSEQPIGGSPLLPSQNGILSGHGQPPAGNVFNDEAAARSAGHKSGDIVLVINPRTNKPARFQLD